LSFGKIVGSDYNDSHVLCICFYSPIVVLPLQPFVDLPDIPV
jgi:hypothetical protein